MANNYIIFAKNETDNTIKDAGLTEFVESGIGFGDEAYSDVLNGILRQLSTATFALAEFVNAKKSTAGDVGSDGVNSIKLTYTLLLEALENWANSLGFIHTDNNPVLGAQSGIKIWRGTQAAYDAISSKNSSTLYFITED